MKAKTYRIAAVVLLAGSLLATVSCKKDNENKTQTVRLTATTDSQSKTVLAGTGMNEVHWQTGDQAMVNGTPLTATGIDERSATFTGEIPVWGGYAYMGSPASATTMSYEGSILAMSVSIPTTQNYSATNVLENHIPMVGRGAVTSGAANVSLKNACSILKVQLKSQDPTLNVKSVRVYTENQNLSGSMSVTFDGVGNPTLGAANGKHYVDLVCSSPVAINNSGYTDFYIAVAPITSITKLLVDVVDENNNVYGREISGVSVAVNEIATVKVKDVSCNHQFVDLGLPSGTLWATCNVGASTATTAGTYFAWGGTSAYASPFLSPYNGTTAPTTLPFDHDAANANWHGSWRMPTSAEIAELVGNCSVTHHGTYYTFTSSSNHRSISLPAAGYYNGTAKNTGAHDHWSSSSHTSGGTICDIYLHGNSGTMAELGTGASRNIGEQVRPVR